MKPVAAVSRTMFDVGENHLFSPLNIFRLAADFENWCSVPIRGNDKSISVLLDGFDGLSLEADNKADHSVRHSDVHDNVALTADWLGVLQTSPGFVVVARCPDVGEMFRRVVDLLHHLLHGFLFAGDHKHRRLSPHGSLDVSVGPRAQVFDFASWETRKNLVR